MSRITEGVASVAPTKTGTHFNITTASGRQVLVAKADYEAALKANGGIMETVSVEQFSKGDTFVATRDSSRTKDDGTPLYVKGETVPRQKDGVQFIAFGTYAALQGGVAAEIQQLEMQLKATQLKAALKALAA